MTLCLAHFDSLWTVWDSGRKDPTNGDVAHKRFLKHSSQFWTLDKLMDSPSLSCPWDLSQKFQFIPRAGKKPIKKKTPTLFTGLSRDQKPGDHPNFRKNALGVKGPFSELSESSGVFSEQLSELEIPFFGIRNSYSRNGLSRLDQYENPQFSEQLPERFPELPRNHPKDFHLPLHSRSVFSRIGVVPAHQKRLSRDCPGNFLSFSWESCLCVFLFAREKGTAETISTPAVRGQCREVVYVYWSLAPEVLSGDSNPSRKDFCRNPRGIYPNEFLGEFCRGFFGGFFPAFFLGKNRRKKSTQKSTAIFKSEFGSFGAKIHTARIRP